MDDDFIRYVLEQNPRDVSRWSRFFARNPRMVSVAEEARRILNPPVETCSSLTEEEVWSLKRSIGSTLQINW